MRILITGHPRSGKSTLAGLLHKTTDIPVRATDVLIPTHEWSQQSEVVSEWFTTPGPWIIEGVTVARALRKYHHHYPRRTVPCDLLITLRRPTAGLLPGQISMSHNQDFFMEQIKPWLDEHMKCKPEGKHLTCKAAKKKARKKKK